MEIRHRNAEDFHTISELAGEALGFLFLLKRPDLDGISDLPSSLSTGPLETKSNSHRMFACLGGCGQPGGERSATDMPFKDAYKILHNPPKGSEWLGSVV